ncbi:MAG: SoxR reducing system RseC family protein [Formivibrio sp.]|nr:SoxR reducing system RseC family protein [Formivibrio sp.]
MSDNTAFREPYVVEGFARIVGVEDGRILLEPEQTGSCTGCASASACNEKGIGTLASRLEARRFSVPNHLALTAGDRVVLGIRPHSLVAASATVYLIPLSIALLCAVLAQWCFGNDMTSFVGMLLGLFFGFVLMRMVSRRIAKDETNEFQIIRLADANEYCR